MEKAQAQRENSHYLPGYGLPEALTVTADFRYSHAELGDDGLLILATAVSGLRPCHNNAALIPSKMSFGYAKVSKKVAVFCHTKRLKKSSVIAFLAALFSKFLCARGGTRLTVCPNHRFKLKGNSVI